MKFVFPVFLLVFFSLVVANWTPEDYEIFSLNYKIKSDLGSDATFYSWLKLERGPKSSLGEINKAYKKMSRALHPDKYSKKSRSQRKKAEERFQRLSLVGNILRDNSLKQRYDFFLRKGFPKWKGTGYYYSRFRPGLGFVLVVLYVLVSTFQFVSLKINRTRDYQRIIDLKQEIKMKAWGDSFVPPSDGSFRKVMSQNELMFKVSPVGEISLIETDENGEQFFTLLDENDIDVNPGFRLSYFFMLPAGLWNITLGKLTGYSVKTEVEYVNPKVSTDSHQPNIKKAKKKSGGKGEKVELQNGKIIYTRKKK
ncbi:hypothetical protein METBISCDRAFT_14455 [Metschnikowia bicuspidata]|uniref:J domain-containing protein n=1 Tax=Metschnikowia bicuspidata TaxID=27322 RepID=A0A4P9ZE39_9ASCO|nr:hypothetical protein METBISCDRAFT_14455 [Metschnikowia bicuspidata]